MTCRAYCRSFTLLEMLLAMTLSVFLFSALIGVMGQIPQPDQVSSRNSGSASWKDAFLELLRADLQSARKWLSNDNQLNLLSHHRLGHASRLDRHRLSWVIYELHSVGGTTWLIRRERELELSDEPYQAAELIAPGIIGFRILDVPPGIGREDESFNTEQAINRTRAPSDIPPSPLPDYETIAGMIESVPHQVLIYIWTEGSPAPAVAERLVLR